MKPLAVEHRKNLERVIVDAREAAETGSRAALEFLAVHYREPYAHMTLRQRRLRRRLRAHARQLGDRRDTHTGIQAIDRLVHECAYEHWHCMLFARFLAENRLLLEPDHGVAVTLDECEELAKDEGIDKWALAARFAQRMLPQVFRPDHPVFEVGLAREHRLKLEGLVEGLPGEVFAAADSLGWVYQFWQSRKKAEVNRSEVKVGADELPAVTQLFTEPYMVSFLLDNSLGAWWVARRLSASDLETAETEAELRRKASIPGVPLNYLRFVRCEDDAAKGAWRVAASAFDGWPERLENLKVLDPCCGSGHFLVAVFLMLVPMRMAREGLDAREAVDAVLGDNLYGLELDSRCVELAAFALARAAWTYPGAGGYRSLPELNLACSGLSVGVAKERWTELAAGRHNLRIALNWMHDEFREAPVLGSLLNPVAADAAKLVDWPDLSAAMADALAREESDERRETAIAAHRLARAAELLSEKYHLVITNVPYLARGKQGKTLRRYSERHYPNAKKELATVFLERCLELCAEGGNASLVLPQNWLFLTSYRKLREKLLKTQTWRLLARLGPGAFETISGEVVKAILLVLTRASHSKHPDGGLFDDARADGEMYGLDVSESRTARNKAVRLAKSEIAGVEQALQLENPDARVALEKMSGSLLLEQVASYQGLKSGDDAAKRRYFWEQPASNRWVFVQSTVDRTLDYGGQRFVFDWQRKGQDLARLQGIAGWNNHGVAVSQMKDLPVALFRTVKFDSNISALTIKMIDHLPAIWCFCSSPEYNEAVRRIDQTLKVTNRTLAKVPFDLDRWTKIAKDKYPNGLPRPYSDDPTQWIFHGHPCGSVIWDEAEKRTASAPPRTDATVLQVAVARLLGYRWPAELDADMELADEQREWVGCCDALVAQADEDGVVCIPSVRGESPAAERLLALLAAAYGDAWNGDVLPRLLAEAGSPTLDDWLRNRFFEQHCKLFHHRPAILIMPVTPLRGMVLAVELARIEPGNETFMRLKVKSGTKMRIADHRPFIWHVWDGRKRDGFHALVNCHKLAEGGGKGRRLLESLTHSYLGDWIRRQQDSAKRGEGGAEERLAAAFELRKRLVAIAEGEPPFDIFVRWKPIEEQSIGWEPDINDGVRINVRPFMAEDILGGKKGAGILRAKPNVHWRKDRGREPFCEPEEFPWYWLDSTFTAERVNNVHLTIEEKCAVRRQVETE